MLSWFALSRARTGGAPRYFRPTSATQFLSTSLHPCLALLGGLTGLTSPSTRGARRFTPTNPLRRDRSMGGRFFACRPRRRSTPRDIPVATHPLELPPLSETPSHLRAAETPSSPRAVTLSTLRSPGCLRRGLFERHSSRRGCVLADRPSTSRSSAMGEVRLLHRPKISLHLRRPALAFRRAWGVPTGLALAARNLTPEREAALGRAEIRTTDFCQT